MNMRKLASTRIILATAVLAATGLLTFTVIDRTANAKESATSTPIPDGNTAALRALGETFGEIATRVGPSVVTVYSEKQIRFHQPEFQSPFGDDSPFRWFFGGGDDNSAPQQQQRPHHPRGREYHYSQAGLGSGIIIDKEGHILTNYHVVKDVDEIKVILSDKRQFDAKIVGTDPKTDVAVIQIKDSGVHDLPVAALGDSDKVGIGDWVVAIGAPFGYTQTITHGIISAKGRTTLDPADRDNYQDFIQTDAPINPGNSGGPLVNLRGEVIGLNTAIATSVGQFSGVGFAIPINMAHDILPTLLKGGKVARGFLGIGIQNVDEDLARQFGLPDNNGALVSQVNDESPAKKAGIEVGDVITRYNGKPVDDTQRLRNLVAATTPGDKVDLTAFRNGKPVTLNVTVGKLIVENTAGDAEAESETPKTSSDLGLTLAPLTPDQATQYHLDENDKGLLVTDVDEDSPGSRAELRPGDLIKQVDHTPVATVNDFHNAVAKAKGNVLLLIKRGAASRFVVVTPGEK